MDVEVEVTRLDTDVAAVGVEVPVKESSRSESSFDWRRAALTFAASLAVLLVIGAAAAIAYERMHGDRILPGVSVAGVEVGGVDRATAERRIRAALPDMGAGE